MHGLINRSIEDFARATYGEVVWTTTAIAMGVDPRGFEIMDDFEPGVSARLITHLALQLDRLPGDLTEDLGAWVAQLAPMRRLLRFSGSDFTAFMMSLEEIRDRGQMVLRRLLLPVLSVRPTRQGWVISSDCDLLWLHAVAGMLHAMADDYGVLAVIEVKGGRIVVDVPIVDFNASRPFSISDPTLGAA